MNTIKPAISGSLPGDNIKTAPMEHIPCPLSENKVEEYYQLVLDGLEENFPRGFWTGENRYEYATRCIRYLLEVVFGWDRDAICANFKGSILTRHGLMGVFTLFNGITFDCLDHAYPGQYKPWELRNTKKNFWNLDVAGQATRWLIEVKLSMSREDVTQQFNCRLLRAHGLGGMLQMFFFNSAYAALDNAYPGEYLPWELSSAPVGYWNNETNKTAIKWLIETRLGWDKETVCQNITQAHFQQNGLGGMFALQFKSSPYAALKHAYPGRYQPWDLSHCPTNTWTTENAIKALRILIEKKLKWDRAAICANYCVNTFKEHGYHSVLTTVFSGSPYLAIEAIYPGEFKPWELRATPNKYWCVETGNESMRWLIDDVLKWDKRQVCYQLSRTVFKSYKLNTMLVIVFKNSIIDALESAYPGVYRPEELVHSETAQWTIEKCKKVITHFMEVELDYFNNPNPPTITPKLIEQYHLSTMVNAAYGGSITKALKSVYKRHTKKILIEEN